MDINTHKIKEEEKLSLNCVTAVLLALYLKVSDKTGEEDPSPQAVARAVANFFFDSDTVKNLIYRSLMEYDNDFRQYDIELEYDHKNEYRNKLYSNIIKA